MRREQNVSRIADRTLPDLPLPANTKTDFAFRRSSLALPESFLSLFFIIPSSTFCFVPIPLNLFIASPDLCCMAYNLWTIHHVSLTWKAINSKSHRALYLRLNDGTGMEASSSYKRRICGTFAVGLHVGHAAPHAAMDCWIVSVIGCIQAPHPGLCDGPLAL